MPTRESKFKDLHKMDYTNFEKSWKGLREVSKSANQDMVLSIGYAYQNINLLNEWEKGFVGDRFNNLLEHGKDFMCTRRQISTLNQIVGKTIKKKAQTRR